MLSDESQTIKRSPVNLRSNLKIAWIKSFSRLLKRSELDFSSSPKDQIFNNHQIRHKRYSHERCRDTDPSEESEKRSLDVSFSLANVIQPNFRFLSLFTRCEWDQQRYDARQIDFFFKSTCDTSSTAVVTSLVSTNSSLFESRRRLLGGEDSRFDDVIGGSSVVDDDVTAWWLRFDDEAACFLMLRLILELTI